MSEPGYPAGASQPFCVAELKDWELHGATWRTLELHEKRAVIELCSCSGEPMDRVESHDPELIEYVRNHRDD
ncbi:MAG: hypothetical protein JO321_06460 [Solirubrobacterales bacterium]|nr:hypothetical protein [Solirubrobacterales bacterium]